MRSEGVPVDGRKLRAQRSKAAVATAALDLIREGTPKPTAADIAERAGVSLRLVFHHFDDMEAVYRDVFRLQRERAEAKLDLSVDPSTPLDRRIAAFVRERADFYEEIGPVERAAILLAPSAPALEEALVQNRRRIHEQTRRLFAPELDTFPGAERRERTALVQTVSGFCNWDTLRREMRLSPDDARAVWRRGLRLHLQA